MVHNIKLLAFEEHHQEDVRLLMKTIAFEFSENIFSAPSADTTTTPLPDKYWVAEINGKVVGTIGFSFLDNRNIVLKRMFLSKEFRGQGLSKLLLDTLIDEALHHHTSTVFLGTMTQFKAAQRFYEKQGFTEISRNILPHDFPVNPVDSVFYKRELL